MQELRVCNVVFMDFMPLAGVLFNICPLLSCNKNDHYAILQHYFANLRT